MKIVWPALLSITAVLALHAQTNTTPPAAETPADSASANKIVPPSEVRMTEIQSDHGSFNMKSNVFIYQGNVRVDNPQMKLKCELLTIEAPHVAEGKFNRATAETNVIIDWLDDKGQPCHATSDKAVYTYSITNFLTNAAVVLTGNPVVTNMQGSFQGDPIIWDRITDTITSPHLMKMTIQSGETNSTGFFDMPAPVKGGAPKPNATENK